MSPVSGRSCSRVSCRAAATMTLTYIYAESRAVLGPIATFSEPHAYDLCERHASRLTVPNGWSVDLMAIADAVREVARNHQDQEVATSPAQVAQVGRRGHLRAVPS
jgi:Protein of unknown function (DUF3499)